ncbi:MAG: T9SS C-terminal target domain-containing protein, partial [Flavobacteriia bacterium]
PIDSVSSERTIASNNEQIIPQWGVSVQIFQTKYYLAGKYTNMIDASMEFEDSSKRWLTGVKDNDAFFPTNWIRSGEFKTHTDTEDDLYNCDPSGPVYLDPCYYEDELGADPTQAYERVLDGIVAPHRVVGHQGDYMPMAYCGTYNPSSKLNAAISFLPSVNIVLTDDKSLWTRCPIVELGRNTGLNLGAAPPGALRKSPSVDKNGNPDGTGTGMGWFPGYAVDIESGARLYMAFGENSFLGGENGADMIWNPTDRLVSNVGTPLMGGMHPVYVFSYNQKTTNGFNFGFDFPAYVPAVAEHNSSNFAYIKYLEIEAGSYAAKRELYGSLSWVAFPLLAPNQTLLSTDVTIRLRINKEYKNFIGSGENAGKPMYGWSMEDIATKVGSQDMLKEALAMINVVPNPYYAFSEYERNKLDNRIKITNLPEQCQIRIYTANGKLVRNIKKDSPLTFQDWDLTNHAGIPVAGGIYLIHVEVPNVGERVLKAFIAMRMVDLQNI